MQITKFHLTLHDSLYYATREMGRLYGDRKRHPQLGIDLCSRFDSKTV